MELLIDNIVGASLVEGKSPCVCLHLILIKADSHTRVCLSTVRYVPKF